MLLDHKFHKSIKSSWPWSKKDLEETRTTLGSLQKRVDVSGSIPSMPGKDKEAILPDLSPELFSTRIEKQRGLLAAKSVSELRNLEAANLTTWKRHFLLKRYAARSCI